MGIVISVIASLLENRRVVAKAMGFGASKEKSEEYQGSLVKKEEKRMVQ